MDVHECVQCIIYKSIPNMNLHFQSLSDFFQIFIFLFFAINWNVLVQFWIYNH